MALQDDDPIKGARETIKEGVSLSPTALVELYHIDASRLGAGHFYLTNDVFGNGQSVIWQGQTFTPYAMEATGFEFKSQGELPRPHAIFSNLFGAFTALNLYYGDLVGAKFIRSRVFLRHLDRENWRVQGSNPAAYNVPDGFNPNTAAGWPDDIFFFHQKIRQTKAAVEYELASILEIENVNLPGRQVFANLCASLYRSSECSYTGIPVADIDGNPVPVTIKINGNPVTADTFDITQVPVWNAATHYHRGDCVSVPLESGRELIVVAIQNGLQGANTQPPNKDFWFADDCSRCLSTGCQKRFGKNPLPFAGFPGTTSTPVTST